MEQIKINKDCIEVLKEMRDESIDCCVTDCPYKIIAWWVRIIEQDDETSWVLSKRKDRSKTDPKWCLNRWRKIMVSDWTNCSNKWLKKNEWDVACAVKDGKMFSHNEIQFSDWLPELYRVMANWTHTYIMINGRNLSELQFEAEICWNSEEEKEKLRKWNRCKKKWFVYQNLLIWKKWNMTPNKYYMQWAEFILMFRKWKARNINDMWSSNIIDIPNIIWNKEHPCLTDNNTILTDKWMVNISLLKKWDKVLTEDWYFNKINYTTKEKVNTDIYLIRASWSNEEVEATHNHPFLVLDKWYVEAKDLTKEMSILEPIITIEKEIKYSSDELFIFWCYLWDWHIHKAGNWNNKYINLSLSKDKADIILPIAKKICKSVQIYNYWNNKYNLILFNNKLADKCIKICWKYSDKKTIHIDILNSSIIQLKEFYRWYLITDWWDFKERKKHRFKTVSENIAYQMKNISQKLWYNCSISKQEWKKWNIEWRTWTWKDFYQLEISYNKEISTVIIKWVKYKKRKIKYIEKKIFEWFVYNLNVNNSHTFLTKIWMSHNTEKPVKLYEYLLKNSTNPWDWVLDPFAWVMPIVKASKELDLNCIAIEIDKEYFDIWDKK